MIVFTLIHDRGVHQYTKTYYEHKREEFKKLNSEGWGIYASVNDFHATPEAMKKAGVKTMRNIQFLKKLNYIFADLDIAKKGDSQTREEKDKKKFALTEKLIEKCEPTKIIDTSNGIQALWKINEDKVDEETQKRYVDAINGIIEWSKIAGASGDKVKDVTRVLRVKGYNHMKEEPYLCDIAFESQKEYTIDQIHEIFKEYVPKEVSPKSAKTQPSDNTLFAEIDRIDFQEVIKKAFQEVGRHAEFDNQGRLILDGRLTGTFQGKKDDRDYLASTSHEQFTGNKITAVADIINITPKEAYRWICENFNIKYETTQAKKVAKEILKQEENHIDESVRYSWGTSELNNNFAIIKQTDYIILGGETGVGKTAFTFFLSMENAKIKHKVLYLSLEMETDEILSDIARSYSGITIEEEYNKNIPEFKQRAFNKKKKELQEIENFYPVGIRRGSDGVTWQVIEEIIKKGNYTMAIVDNLDLIDGAEDLEKQRNISKSIMNFTASEKIPVILLHHFRKQQGGKKESTRGVDSLRGSAKLSHDADRIILLSRNFDAETKKEEAELRLYLKKARGYKPCMKTIYFHKGSFYDYFIQ